MYSVWANGALRRRCIQHPCHGKYRIVLNKQFCVQLGLSPDLKLFTPKFFGIVARCAKKCGGGLARIISDPNEMEYLILWPCLIWISHMKAIKRWLPFMGRREEKMSIKLILLERMKREAAIGEPCFRCIVGKRVVCVSVQGRPFLLWCHQQGHMEGQPTAPTPHQFSTPTPHPSQSESAPVYSQPHETRWDQCCFFFFFASDDVTQGAASASSATVSICSSGSPQWSHYPLCQMYLWNCCGEILYGSLKWRVWEVKRQEWRMCAAVGWLGIPRSSPPVDAVYLPTVDNRYRR